MVANINSKCPVDIPEIIYPEHNDRQLSFVAHRSLDLFFNPAYEIADIVRSRQLVEIELGPQ